MEVPVEHSIIWSNKYVCLSSRRRRTTEKQWHSISRCFGMWHNGYELESFLDGWIDFCYLTAFQLFFLPVFEWDVGVTQYKHFCDVTVTYRRNYFLLCILNGLQQHLLIFTPVTLHGAYSTEYMVCKYTWYSMTRLAASWLIPVVWSCPPPPCHWIWQWLWSGIPLIMVLHCWFKTTTGNQVGLDNHFSDDRHWQCKPPFVCCSVCFSC